MNGEEEEEGAGRREWECDRRERKTQSRGCCMGGESHSGARRKEARASSTSVTCGSMSLIRRTSDVEFPVADVPAGWRRSLWGGGERSSSPRVEPSPP